jgi:hypothetical protein
LSVLGTTSPANVVVNEITTVASVWTHNQFIDGTAVKGSAMSLKIAAGNKGGRAQRISIAGRLYLWRQ